MTEHDDGGMQALIEAKQQEVLDHLWAGRSVQLEAHGQALGSPIEPRAASLAEERAVQLFAQGHRTPHTARLLAAPYDEVLRIGAAHGHDLRWDDQGRRATCGNRPCIGRIFEEGHQRYSGSMLWMPCPVTIPLASLTAEQAEAMWDEENGR